ncbi:MAG TPA: hypothetical protein VF234_03745, partial [Limnochordia bacterium]
MRQAHRPASLAVAAALAGLFAFTPLRSSAAQEPRPDNLVIRNEYIAIMVNARPQNTGRFSVYTTGGDPMRLDDDDKPLTYGVPDPGPWTSYTTVQIDGTGWVFGGPTDDRPGRTGRYGSVVQAPTRVGTDQIVATWKLGPIEATQALSFVKS